MTNKLYLDDSYLTGFEAAIVGSRSVAEGCELILEATCFYPESGGQPADRGTIGGAEVLDVQLRGDDVVHVLAGEPPQSPAQAEIDWELRYDHMQQHTGQHLLTSAFIELFDAGTVGFHLGEKSSTIDVALTGLSPDRAKQAEELCSGWITSALQVSVEYVSLEQFKKMDLRKKALPEEIADKIRLIRVGDVDVAHCGGTHLRNTAELQAVKIVGTEKVRDITRVNFLAGKRAMADYSLKHSMLAGMSGKLTCSIGDLPDRMNKMQEDARETLRELKKVRKELIAAGIDTDLAKAEEAGRYKVFLSRRDGWRTEELKMLASGMTSAEPRLICCCVSAVADSGFLVLAAGEEFDGDLGEAVSRLLPLFDGKGGGKGRFAQAVGDPSRMDELIAGVETMLKDIGSQR